MKNAAITRTRLDRLRYIIVFELLLIAMLAPLGAFVLDKAIVDVGLLSIFLSVKAMVLGYFYNLYFDGIDVRAGRNPSRRSIKGRVIHALGFEFTLVITSVPIVIWWLGLTLIQALVMDAVVSSLVVIYTFLYTCCYDWLFPLRHYESKAVTA